MTCYANRAMGTVAAALLTLAIAGSATAQTQGTAPTMPVITAKSVLKELTTEIPKVAQHEARIVHAEIHPGQASMWHTHPAPVLVYVLEGTLVYELEGQEPKTFSAGEAFMEPANRRNRAVNKSEDRPVKVIAIQVADPKEPFTVNLP